jgi:dTDP-4-dehydrorhamnose reductase
MNLLVIGLKGQIASALLGLDQRRPDLRVTAIGRPVFDLQCPDVAVIARCAPDVVINAAAYTAVDQAESNEALAYRINADGAGAVSAATARLNIPVIQLSTDYVFSGSKLTPYVETDEARPLNVYGRSKLAGERQVAENNPRHVILRTSWVYSAIGTNFLTTMLRLARSRCEIDVVADQFGSPTAADDIALAIIEIAGQLVRDRSDVRGIFHMSAGGDTSWCGFAKQIFAESARLGGPAPSIHPITTAGYPTPARRPRNSRLDCRKIATVFGVILPPWQDSVRPSVAAALS